MRVAILHFLDKKNNKVQKVLKNLTKGLESNSHQVTVLDGFVDMDNVKLPIYEYIYVLAKPASLFSAKLPEKISYVLANCGTLIGKKSSALILQSGFMSEKACNNLMSIMEKEGMFVNNFCVVDNTDYATYLGKKL